MEISEGMYIRTNNGFISKIICFKSEPISNNEIILIKGKYKGNKDKEYGYVRDYYGKGTSFLYRGEIIKASYNIIDLIQIGDILLIKDFVDEASMIFTNMYYIRNENQLFNIKRDLEKNKNMKISKILTKEQMESIAYEVK